ncbi:MAG TPA: hypothetical protein VK877_04105 [Pseudolabrys sp.]|nr:hypothetical protein [Pseudolabrys sp.]
MDVLYHYCSTSAFHAIVEAAAIRLSSLSLANDTLEGKIVSTAIERLAFRDKLDAPVRAELSRAIQALEKILDNLGFCLSEEGDLLSQWRGYAADATGVSIGNDTASTGSPDEPLPGHPFLLK